jgi:hypothetical protein
MNRNNGKKHKSPSKIERDNRCSDTWHAKQESNKIESFMTFSPQMSVKQLTFLLYYEI